MMVFLFAFCGSWDALFCVYFIVYMYRWKSSEPINKAFLCTIASGLGLTNLIMHGSEVYTNPHVSGSPVISFTNAYMRNYFIVDLAAMAIRKSLKIDNLRVDMLIHHAVMIPVYVFSDNLGASFAAIAEVISIWEYCLSNAPPRTHYRMRMLSIYPVRLFVWISLVLMTHFARLNFVHRTFCIGIPILMVPMDAYWFYRCYRRYVEIKGK